MPLRNPVLLPGQEAEALSGHHLRPPALGCLNQHGWASVRDCALGPVLCLEVSQTRLNALTVNSGGDGCVGASVGRAAAVGGSVRGPWSDCLPVRASQRVPCSGSPPLKPASKLPRLHLFSAGRREVEAVCAKTQHEELLQ